MSDININPDTLLTSDLLLQTVDNSEIFSPDRKNMTRTISLTSIDSNSSTQSDDYVINKSEEKDDDNKVAIDHLKKSNTILKKMLNRLITRDNLSDEEKQSLLQDIKAYELEELSEYVSLHLSMSNDYEQNEYNESLKMNKVDTSFPSPSKKTRPITPGYPLIVAPIIEPKEDKDAYKKILKKPQIATRKAKMNEDEKINLSKAMAKKNRRLRIFKKAEEIMNEIEYQEKKRKELELKNGKKSKNNNLDFFKYSVKEMDEKITRKKAKEAIVKVRLKLSAGNQEFAHGPLKPVEEKMLLSPYAAPICDQMIRNIVVDSKTKANRK
jgi:hypothetical protein